jgi:hypothetical protein
MFPMQPGWQYEGANQRRVPSLPTSARAVPLQLHQSTKPVRQDVSWIWRSVQDLDGVQPQVIARECHRDLMRPGKSGDPPGNRGWGIGRDPSARAGAEGSDADE